MKEFKLDNLSKINPGFKVPNGYFEDNFEEILAHLDKKESKIISLFRFKKTLYFVAAALLILMMSIPLYNKYTTDNREIDSATLEDYIAYHATISEDEIVNLLEIQDLEKMKIEYNFQDKEIEDALYSNQNLEQYFIN